MRPRQQTSPGIAPQAASTAVSESMLPESDGWDAADTVTGISDDDTKTLVRDQPAIDEVTASPPPVKEREPERTADKASDKTLEKPREKTVTSVLAATPIAPSVVAKPPAAATAAAAIANVMPSAVPVTSAMREEVWTIVRAAVDQAVAPLGTRIKELETRLERAEKGSVQAKTAPVAAQASSASSRLASIPVTGLSSIPPALSPGANTSVTFSDADVKSVRPSMPATGLGIVVVPPGPRPAIDLEAIAKQPTTDIEWNPAGNKRLVGRVVVVLMILAVGTAVVLTIMSHSGPH